MKIIEELPPFLAKLLQLTQNTAPTVAKWNLDGSIFVIMDEEPFKKTLKKYFKGTKQTFIRQLHFYGFKKVDTKEGVWGFAHEKQLFIRNNTELIGTIKRKKKIDPDTQRIATYYEVQALKNQITFLQEIIEELRGQVVGLKKGKTSGSKSNTPQNSIGTSLKRQRKDNDMNFKELCAKVNAPTKNSVDLSTLPSFTNTMDIDSDLENLSELFVDLDLVPIESSQLSLTRIPSYQQSLIEENDNFTSAVDAISEATNVKKTDVSKILSFLSNLSIKEQQSLDIKKESVLFPPKFNAPRVQKVGAS